MHIELNEDQIDAVNRMKNGCILCGNVGTGKSRTALAYYILKDCKGKIPINGNGFFSEMKSPRDLYIITTAKKRDSTEWIKECQPFTLTTDPETSMSNVKVTIDSWNNIKKYKNVVGAFFIFDEQRVVGYGSWVKAFLNITRKNHWVLLSATPGDTWSDYIPVFIANGFYRNKSEFSARHIVYSRFAKYPKIDKYIDQGILMKHRNDILVVMKDRRDTRKHKFYVPVEYDKQLYKIVMKDRWDPFANEPITETGKLCYLMRQVINSDKSRIDKLSEIFTEHQKLIIFYNFDYELKMIREFCQKEQIVYSEWNGHNHDNLPIGESWIYIVQYVAGCEGWNCTTTDTIVFYSQSYSYRQTEQAAGRIDRMNTPYKDLYYYTLRSTASIDLAIYRALSQKKNFNKNIFVNSIS